MVVNYPNHQWIFEGEWKGNQPHGKGKIVIGKYAMLSNTVFEGEFTSGASTGTLTRKNGTKVPGELRFHYKRGFSEFGIRFYSQA